MTDYVLSGLTKRRAELAGEADALRSRLVAIAADMVHLDAVIRQFDPDYNLASIRPKRPRGPDVAQRGERSRALLGVLREAAEPLTTTEVVRCTMAKQGQGGEGCRFVKQVTKRLSMALARQEKQGAVQALWEDGQAVRWETAR